MNSVIKAGKTILNAMAFANADNYSEFRALLRQADENRVSSEGAVHCQPVSAASGIASAIVQRVA